MLSIYTIVLSQTLELYRWSLEEGRGREGWIGRPSQGLTPHEDRALLLFTHCGQPTPSPSPSGSVSLRRPSNTPVLSSSSEISATLQVHKPQVFPHPAPGGLERPWLNHSVDAGGLMSPSPPPPQGLGAVLHLRWQRLLFC